jgi:vesicular inhibitory amino acid transporter
MLYKGRDGCAGQILTYQELGLIAGGCKWENIVRITLGVNQTGYAILYLVLLADNMNLLFGAELFGSVATTHVIWVAIFAVAVAPVLCIPRLKEVSLVSAFSFLSIVYVWAMSVVELADREVKPLPNAPAAKQGLLAVSGSLGMIVFAFGAHPLFPSIQSSMAEPEKFARVIYSTQMISFAFFVAVGVLGYHACGVYANANFM